MRKTIFLSAALALATSGVFARELSITTLAQGQSQKQQGTVEERAKRQADRLNGTAQLSPDQYTKALDILKNSITQRDAARSSGAQGDDLRAKFKAIGQQEDAQLKGVLSADQYAKVQAAKKEHQGSPRGGE